jgi:hypothetical protein
MTIQCAWCGLHMGYKFPLENTHTSHGMCENCRGTWDRQLQLCEMPAIQKGVSHGLQAPTA